MVRGLKDFHNFNVFITYSFPILLLATALEPGDPSYVPGLGLTNKYFGLSRDDASRLFVGQEVELGAGGDPNACQASAAEKYINCDWSSPYRNIDGTCNNPLQPFMGATGECFARERPAVYKGRSDLRTSTSGRPLPEVRQLSLGLFPDLFRPAAQGLSMQFAFFGQYIAHDVSFSYFEPVNGSCCSPDLANHPSCLPIRMRTDDPFYSMHNVTCYDFLRALTCASCGTGSRELQNRQTAALDASITYGPTADVAAELRANDGTGRLKSEPGLDLLPQGRASKDLFCPDNLDTQCFKSGDLRVNQHAYLMTWHTIVLREHNRLADRLKQLNPFWDEETIYQEARRIVIAELQCITFRDFLPLLLGPSLSAHYVPPGLGFDPSVQLRTLLEFAGAAFRLHSMIASAMGQLRFGDSYANPSLLREGRMTEMMAAACTAPTQPVSPHLSTDTTNHLYQLSDELYGQDLAANDILRGRDAGLSPYVDYCEGQGEEWTSFEQLGDIIGAENVELLKKNYEHVRDVDLWVGFNMEKPLPGSLLGPVGSRLVGEQFRRLKFGDRFFWENEGQFTPAQRESLQRCSLSRLLCDNVEGVTRVNLNAFRTLGTDNPLVACDQLPAIDVTPWKST